MNPVRRVFVSKKPGYDLAAQALAADLRENLELGGLEGVRIFACYDVAGLDEGQFAQAVLSVFSEPNADDAYPEALPDMPGAHLIMTAYLPGQFDQRADSAAQCAQLIWQKERPQVASSTVYALFGRLEQHELTAVRRYLINPMESHEVSLEKPDTLTPYLPEPGKVEAVEGFMHMTPGQIEEMTRDLGMAMTAQDLMFCQKYFREEAGRDPSMTELRVLDTYWSDHCRHTTFLTAIDKVSFETSPLTAPAAHAYSQYLKLREELYQKSPRDMTLMDIAVIGMKALRAQGKLEDLDESDEINACSIVVDADVDGQTQKWLVLFKNETHNHPTEIEPFGGAATCLGGAIRDPLSGRAYVYQAMRITGSADPRAKVSETMPGKLPQRKLTLTAAAGFSAYGNQIGLAAGKIQEVYHPGYMAKRLETGAVIAAVPYEHVRREKPLPGDLVILVGGRTGRDGCGGATGSSKAHTTQSLVTCGAEVQKGNPPTERHIQRLFRQKEFARMIKKCNDFGAGGVAVAIGELADGLLIDLSSVPRKYDGLDGTELAISESQERMACVIDPGDEERFIAMARAENLEATRVAVVTDRPHLSMTWRGDTIVDISRAFLDTNGVTQHASAHIAAPDPDTCFFTRPPKALEKCRTLSEAWMRNLQQLNVCSQKGLVERFDGTIGAGTVIAPFGGKTRLTPNEAMAAKLPVMGHTNTATLMAHGFHPEISTWSPFHGAAYAVVESLAKLAAAGGDVRRARLTFQEYFERLRSDPARWGKPFCALLGALSAQLAMEVPAIGGKDSMSGTFEHIDVPPTLISFAVCAEDARRLISPELKGAGHGLYLLPVKRGADRLPDYGALRRGYLEFYRAVCRGEVLSAHTVSQGGVAAAATKMALGNMIGIAFEKEMTSPSLFGWDMGALVFELAEGAQPMEGAVPLGRTLSQPIIQVLGQEILLEDAREAWETPLEGVFPTRARTRPPKAEFVPYPHRAPRRSGPKVAKPRVALPVFPGTNCEYDTQRAFERAGAAVHPVVVRNLGPQEVAQSVEALAESIRNAQILMLPGGFSGGDEPDGSAKYIAAMLRNPRVAQAVTDLIEARDGLVLGICNGFQALIKTGLLPYGRVMPQLSPSDPTLTFNHIGRHIALTTPTVVSSVLSPWLSRMNVGDVHQIPMSHGEGRLVATEQQVADWLKTGQIATQYADESGRPANTLPQNPNGSVFAIEGLSSPDGRILGKMGHTERGIDPHVGINIPGQRRQLLFEGGVEYFG